MAKNLTTGLQRGLRQSIAGGLGTGDLFSTASLDLQFARHKSLDSRVTHTRQSSATYVDGDGVIRKAVTNLLTYSEEFDNSNWTGASPTVTPNVALSPDGTTTADKVEVAQVRQTANPVTSGANYAISFYIKSDETTAAAIRLRTGYSGGASNFWWIPSTGLFGTVGTEFSNATVASIGNNWYRVSAIFTVPSGITSVEFAISGVSADGGGTISGHFVIWGAQLEQSSTVGQYVKTTSAINSAPRFDHDPETGESLGLLVEESRINYATQSESFSGWTVQQLTQSTASDVVAPDGTTGNVQLFTEDETSNTHRLFIAPSAGGAADHAHTIFAKVASGTRRIYLGSDNSSGARRTLIFDLINETYDNTTGGIEDWSNITIQAYPNGWYRIGAVIEDNGGSTLQIWGTVPDDSSDLSFLGDGTSGFYLWGAQLETGSFPTSYIPTEGSTVTRAADVASITGTNFSSWYNDSEGTVFVDAASPRGALMGFSDGTNTERYRLVAASTALAGFGTSGGSTQFNLNTGANSWVSPDSGKGALGLKLNDFSVVANGNYTATDSSGTLSSVNRIFIGNAQIDNPLNGTIRRLTYWPTRLSNDTLQTITT